MKLKAFKLGMVAMMTLVPLATVAVQPQHTADASATMAKKFRHNWKYGKNKLYIKAKSVKFYTGKKWLKMKFKNSTGMFKNKIYYLNSSDAKHGLSIRYVNSHKLSVLDLNNAKSKNYHR